MAWTLDEGKLCNTLGESSLSMAEVAVLPAQQKAKYLAAGTPRNSLKGRDRGDKNVDRD